MTDRPAITAVAFDLMDTLVHDPWKAGLRAAFGDRFEAAMADRDPTSWPRFETGEITEDEFWATYAEHRPDPEACRAVRRARTAWLPGMRDLIAELRGNGTPVAIATNYPSWINDLESDLLTGVADVLVASCRIGARKPDRTFYEVVATRLDVPPGQIAFVDDRPTNTTAAQTVGMHGVVFADATSTRTALRSMGLNI